MKNDYYKYIKQTVKIKDICNVLGIPIYEGTGGDKCNCPFHEDKTPSMMLYDDNHAFCFACQKRWDNLDFVGEKLGLDFDKRIKWMEQKFPNLLLQKPYYIKSEEKNKLETGYDIAYAVYADMSEKEEKNLKEYAESRGFKKDFLIRKDVFYASKSKIKNRFTGDENVSIAEQKKLDNCQLIIRQPWQEKDITDRYADYYSEDGIILTIRDHEQNIVGFAQRALGDRKPKYRFTKKLPKKTLLYGLADLEKNLAIQKGQQPIDVYLVEGMFDALRLEALGKYGLAVLGSQLTISQTAELERILSRYQSPISLHIFMDSDEAGVKGNVQTLKNLWNRSYFRHIYIDVYVSQKGKDPCECCETGTWDNIRKYLPFEYLFYYYLPDNKTRKDQTDTKEIFHLLTTEDRIICLSQIDHWLVRSAWIEVLGIYASVAQDDFFYEAVKRYIGGEVKEYSDQAVTRSDLYQFQAALQVASASYDREALPLDESTWNRIQICADTFFEFFRERLGKGQNLHIPMLAMYYPKRMGEARKKSIYIHERLILQQYVLNELLGAGENGYETYIPAVRYSRQDNEIYTTNGTDAQETVSFAYEIDMDVMLRGGDTDHGMFREYYEGWRAYIEYIQDGINRLSGNDVYRVKLDIDKFYDNIQSYVARNAIFKAVREGLRADSSKFSAFKSDNEDVNTLAEKVTRWILGELYEPYYYDPETGAREKKQEELKGIPQGPNLSAYIANIILFDMDRKVFNLVKEMNMDLPDGTIAVRYARYVDDMIIISSDADILMEIKSLISSELYNLGLSLSPKTDREDGITKDEAMVWTMDERGGLGVSATFDFPDDTLDDVLDEIDEYETTDRRTALKLLESAASMMREELFLEEDRQEQLIKTLFRTEEIRFMDIVRISELLLVKANGKGPDMTGNIFKDFLFLWGKEKQSSPKDSLFWEDGIEIFAFIEACNKVLKRKPLSLYARKQFQVWKAVQEAVGQCWSQDFEEEIENLFPQKDVLKQNQWVLTLRLAEIKYRLPAGQAEAVRRLKGEKNQENQFFWRWFYALSDKEADFIHQDFPENKNEEEKIFAVFHHAVFQLGKIGHIEEYNRVKSDIVHGEYEIFAKTGIGVLSDCLHDWFRSEENEIRNAKNTRITLFTLLNVLRDSIKAEIIGGISGYQDYIFQNSDGKSSICLPVVPGTGYPGLIGQAEGSENGKQKIQRIDFIEPTYPILEIWQKNEREKEFHLYNFEMDDAWHSLDLLLNSDFDESQIKLILELYPILADEIRKIQESSQGYSVILSKRNVFVKQTEEGENQIRFIQYLLPQEDAGNGVLLDTGGGFSLKTLHDSGNYFWQAGYLLKDASNFDNICLKYKSDGTYNLASAATMMEYTFNRLTGISINTKNAPKEKHSYKMSVERAIKRTRSFLNMESARDIFLEDNAVMDSFISRRMRRNVYRYEPSNCSYYVAVWSKDYLRSGFDRLMNLTEKTDGTGYKNNQVKRRVPKAYLALADCIGRLSRITEGQGQTDCGFSGLKVLECGLRANGALLQLRMQALELFESLKDPQREELKKQKEDLPLAVLELEDAQPLAIEGYSITDIISSILESKSDERVGKITHIGWLVLLEWLLEFENYNPADSLETITEMIRNCCQKILGDTDEIEAEFPFEQMNPFFALWKEEQTNQLFQLCDKIDERTGTEVQIQHAEFYRQTMKQQVVINTGSHRLKKPNYFLTFSKLGKELVMPEQEAENTECKIFTQSMRNGAVVGISFVESRWGRMLQGMEKFKDSQTSEDKAEIETEQKEEEASCPTDAPAQEERERNADSEEKGEGKERYENEKQGTFRKELRAYQENSWGNRHKEFDNFNRIALFQFQTKCTYFHPMTEQCKEKVVPGIKSGLGYSCEEFRREELLNEVLDICNLLRVEILLLPEYSVRPETVEYLKAQLKAKGCKFSIWAGTFRIPQDYQFRGNVFEDLNGKNDIYHAAVLPVIVPEEEKVFCGRKKKYPSIALTEDINPVSIMDDNFSPIMEQMLNRDINKMILEEYDARKVVTELICAELFALSSPGNIWSFAEAAFQLYRNYGGTVSTLDEFKKKVLTDIMRYGESISLYQKRNKIRKSIVLVPACTTRAEDYYVLGQANYLGPGTNMVFCNGSEKLACGGSCFIGQNSWDDRKNRTEKKPEKAEANIYHGLFPGIYMQGSGKPGRGGLGHEEQALLVCDIVPDLDKRKPNPESMKKSLEVIAHIPFLEEAIFPDECIKKCYYRRSGEWEYRKRGAEESRNKTSVCLESLYNRITQLNKNITTASDDNPFIIAEKLIELGNRYHSEWLVERGERYLSGHKLLPRRWIPETALDWRYLEVNYQKFLDNVNDYCLIVPESCNSEKDMETKGKIAEDITAESARREETKDSGDSLSGDIK